MKRIIAILSTLLFIIPSFSQTMEWYVKDNYTEIVYMGHDLFKVKNSAGKWGIINEYGELSVDTAYEMITPFVENRALLLDATGLFLKGIVNEKGQLIKRFHNDEVVANFQHYKEGYLAYGIPAGKFYNYGYLDLNGNTSIEPKYFWVAPFSGGKAVVHYKSGNYGIINKTGNSTLMDNRKFKFMSSPVENTFVIAYGSSRGDKISLVRLKPDGRLEDIEDFETGTVVIQQPGNYSMIYCQNGTSYHFDDAMRLISSSRGKTFNHPLSIEKVIPSISPSLKKSQNQGKLQILFKGKSILCPSFRDAEFHEDKYAVVTNYSNNKGILKLNEAGNAFVSSIPDKVEFRHNAEVDGSIALSIMRLNPASHVEIGIIGLSPGNEEKIYSIPKDYNGVFNQPISYFIPAERFDSEVSIPIIVNIYINGMLYSKSEHLLTGIHRNAFRISEANAPQYSDADGNATITFNVQSLDKIPSPSARVIVSGSYRSNKTFNGEDAISFRIPVSVPFESEQTYTFTVTVKEDGCPPYTRKISRTIKHYDLQ